MKFSIRTLLLWVAFAAVLAAALARPSLLWTRLLFTLSLLFCGASLIGCFTTRGKRRTFWIGAAVIGAIYYSAWNDGFVTADAFGGTESSRGRALISQSMLEQAGKVIGHQFPFDHETFEIWDSAMFSVEANDPQYPNESPPPTDDDPFGVVPGPVDTLLARDFEVSNLVLLPMNVSNKAVHGRYSQYLVTGHSAFTIILGVLGGYLSQWFFKAASDEPT